MTSESTYEQDQSRWGTATCSGADRRSVSPPGDTLEALAEFFSGQYSHSASLPSGSRLSVPGPQAEQAVRP